MKKFYKLFIAMFCIAIGLSPVIAYAEETTTVEVTIDSDYENVVVESENGKENVNTKNLILTFSDVGEYEYKIYTNEDLENVYTVKVLVGRNENNQLYTETVLYNNKNKDVKLDKIEFKKKITPEEPKKPEEPKQKESTQPNEFRLSRPPLANISAVCPAKMLGISRTKSTPFSRAIWALAYLSTRAGPPLCTKLPLMATTRWLQEDTLLNS